MSRPKQNPQKRSAREMELEDILADVLNGIRVWKRAIGAGEWQDHDEALLRWLEAGPAGELLV